MSKKALPTPDRLPTYHPKTGELLAIIESPKGCRTKLKFDEALQSYLLSKVLPVGANFPFDFGFIPGTCGDDGDPLDVLLIMDEPVYPGCAVEVRLIGVIEATQKEKGQKPEENDRLIAVATRSHDYADVKKLQDLPRPLVKEIEHFFVSYNQLAGKVFKVRGERGPKRAMDLLERGIRAQHKG